MTQDEKIDTYEPTIVSQKPLDIEYTDDSFDDITNGGLIKTKLNEQVIIQRIAKDLYKNSTSGLRELYNNAARACRIANKEYPWEGDAFVRITIDKDNRQLIIEDVCATGISIARFKQVLLVLGTSDNLNSKEVGQFGMGFASYTTLSSALILETKSRVKGKDGEYQNYKMVAKDGLSFQPVGKSKLDDFGTKLTMTLYEDVDIDKLLETLRQLVRFSGIKTVLELKNYQNDDDYRREYRTGDSETVYEAKTILQEIEKIKARKSGIIHFDNDDFEFVAAIGATTISGKPEVLIVGTLIESEINLPCNQWILNIKDERKFKPMPDRDRLTESADKALQFKLNFMIKEHFNKVRIRSYDELRDSPYKSEFLWLCNYGNSTLMPESEREFMILFNFVVKEAARGKFATTHNITLALENFDEIIYMNNNTKNAVDKMESLYKDKNILPFTFTKGKKNVDWSKELQILEDFGVRNSSTIFKENRIKIIQEKKALKDVEILVHYNTGYYQKSYIDVEEVDDKVMMIDEGSTTDVIGIIRRGRCPYKITKYMKEFKDTDVLLWSEFRKDLPEMEVDTNMGPMTIEKFYDHPKDKYLCVDYRDEFEDIATRCEDKLIMTSKDMFFAYRAYAFYDKNDEQEYIKETRLSELIKQLTTIQLYDDTKQTYFVNHYREVKNSHWPILASLIDSISVFHQQYKMDENEWGAEVLGAFDKQLAFVKTIPDFDVTTPYQTVKSYQKFMDTLDKESTHYYKIQELMDIKIKEIEKNDYILSKAIKKLVLPQLFTEFDLRYLKKVERSGYYGRHNNFFKATIRTKDTTFIANSSIDVYSWTVSAEITKVERSDNGYMTVSLYLELSN